MQQKVTRFLYGPEPGFVLGMGGGGQIQNEASQIKTAAHKKLAKRGAENALQYLLKVAMFKHACQDNFTAEASIAEAEKIYLENAKPSLFIIAMQIVSRDVEFMRLEEAEKILDQAAVFLSNQNKGDLINLEKIAKLFASLGECQKAIELLTKGLIEGEELMSPAELEEARKKLIRARFKRASVVIYRAEISKAETI